MTRNNKLAWLFGCGPIVAIVSILVVYALLNFILASGSDSIPAYTDGIMMNGGMGMGAPTLKQTVGRVVNMFLSLAGLIAIFAVPVGIVLAIVYATKTETAPSVQPPIEPSQK